MKRLFSAVLCVCAIGAVSASDIGERLSAVLPGDTVSLLLAKGRVQKSSYKEKGVSPTLAPSSAISGEAIGFWSGKDAVFFAESLYLYKKKNPASTAPGSDVPRISAILRSLSRLEGVQYYSVSRKKMRTLYEKSYCVEGPKTKARVADPVAGSAEGLSVYALQKDLTFGEYVYQYSYRQTADTVAFFSQNSEAMNFMVLKLIDPGKLRVSLIVQDLGDYLLVYGLTRADFPAVPAIESRLNASFSNREEAIYEWFIREYEKQ
ncbi:MAG TPA: hypothetical protein PK542_13085 [Treponemataceae bacterium]|nr:hypothetical protein [Treponemataceae bacterium]